MIFLYTDIDYVLSLATETKYISTKWGMIQRFNDKAVKVYNNILKETSAIPIITSKWREDFTLQQLREIFLDWAKIEVPPYDVTSIYPSTEQTRGQVRAKEILDHVLIHKPEAWIAIDDELLYPWIDEDHFVWLTRTMEGIKQSGKKQEIIKKIKTQLHE